MTVREEREREKGRQGGERERGEEGQWEGGKEGQVCC